MYPTDIYKVNITVVNVLHQVEYARVNSPAGKYYLAMINGRLGKVRFKRASDALEYQKRSIALNRERMLRAKGLL